MPILKQNTLKLHCDLETKQSINDLNRYVDFETNKSGEKPLKHCGNIVSDTILNPILDTI